MEPFVPFEFTHEGMMHRINTYVDKQDFCWLSEIYAPKIGPNGPSAFNSPNIDLSYFKVNHTVYNEWPPRSALSMKLGNSQDNCITTESVDFC